MKSLPGRRGCASALAAMLVLACGPVAGAGWTFTVLHPGSPTAFARASAVYGNRQAGTADDGYSHPYLWTGTAASESPLVEPSPNSGPAIYAMTANAIIGYGYVSTSPTDGYYGVFVWNRDGSQVSVIPPPAGYFEAEGLGGTDTQQVGVVYDDTSNSPALWSGTAASFVNLLPAGYTSGGAYAADGNQQAGYVHNGTNGVAALWTGTAQSFLSLHPQTGGWTDSEVNGAGGGHQVGDVSKDNPYTDHACAWSGTAASFVDLHPTDNPALAYSYATGVSQAVVCGIAYSAGSSDHALVWTSLSSAAMFDLTTVLSGSYDGCDAYGVWTDGSTIRVVGSAYNSDTGNDEAILWTYTPGVGACCSGQLCSVVAPSGCAGAFIGDGTTCGPGACCRADFDDSGTLAVADIFAFLNAWFAGDPRADFDGASGLQVADIFAFLNAWFAGC